MKNAEGSHSQSERGGVKGLFDGWGVGLKNFRTGRVTHFFFFLGGGGGRFCGGGGGGTFAGGGQYPTTCHESIKSL